MKVFERFVDAFFCQMNYYFSKGPPMKEGLRADDIFQEQMTFSILTIRAARADYIFHQLPCCHLLCRGYCPVKACPGFSCHATWIQCTALGLSQGDGLASLQVCFCHVCACLLFVFGMFTWHQFASAVLKLAVISIFPWTSAV